MTLPDPFVAALKALCRKEGGAEFVADRAHVSADNLKQIIAGTPLPSGNLRSVGARLRKSLTDAYPDWLGISEPASTTTPKEIKALEGLFLAIAPEFRAAAIAAATQAMISFLSPHTSAGHDHDAQEAKPSESRPAAPVAHKTP